MATKYALLFQASTSGSPASYYTAPTATQAAIHAASVTNPTGSAVTCNLYLVPASGSATTANRIASRTVIAGATVTLQDAINHKIPSGYQLYADGAGCSFTVSGVEYVPGT